MATLNAWATVDANNNAAPPDGWPENTMQYSEVNNTGRAVQGTMARYFRDVNGSLQAGGVADAYTVTLNETSYTAYFAGMYFACGILATNTGASTINVNGIGVQNIVQRDGTPLPAGILDVGGIYEFRYDGTNFQLMGTLGGAVSLAQATLTNDNDVDLVDTDVALRVGAADPDTASHIEVSDFQIQSKADAATAQQLSLNPLGGDVRAGAQSGTGSVRLFDDGIERFATSTLGDVFVRNNSNADPTVPDIFSSEIQFRTQDNNEYGGVGYAAGTALRVFNRAHGGLVQLNGENAAGSARVMVEGDPDGSVTLRYPDANIIRALTIADHFAVRSDGNTDTEQRGVNLQHQNGTNRATLRHNGAEALIVRNQIHGGNINLEAENAGGIVRSVLVGDPDNDTALFDNGVEVARTLPTASGGFEVNNTSTGAGFERVLTISDLGAGIAVEAIKTSDDSVLNSTTLVDDSELSGFALAANTTYRIDGYFIVSADNVAAGIRYALQSSQVFTNSEWGSIALLGPTNDFSGVQLSTTTVQGYVFDDITTKFIRVQGFVVTGGSAPIVDLQFAQQVAVGGSNTFMRTGSWLQFIPIA